MKKTSSTTIISAILCLSACAPAMTSSEGSASGKLVTDGLYPTERSFSAKDEISIFDSTPYREGTTPEGYTYKIYPDGSAGIKTSSDTLSGWNISCIKDAMTDRRKCELSSHNASLFISYGYAPNPKWICISGHDFPYRKGEIRIDQAKPVTTDFDGCIPGKYANQLYSGTKVTTRSYKWPYDYSVDKSASLEGIKGAMSLVTHIRNNIDHMSFEGGVKKSRFNHE